MTKIYLANDKKRGQRTAKPLTGYAVPLAFQRIDFYLDVLDAHFAALGVRLKDEQNAGNRTMQNPAREKKTQREGK